MIRFLILLLLILKLFLLFFEWVGSWCSVTRAVIFFLMNSLFEEKCSSGCPKTINKLGQIHEIVLAGKTTTLHYVTLAKLLDKESDTFHL